MVSTRYAPRKTGTAFKRTDINLLLISWCVSHCPAGPPDEKYTLETSFSYVNTLLERLPKEEKTRKNRGKTKKILGLRPRFSGNKGGIFHKNASDSVLVGTP